MPTTVYIEVVMALSRRSQKAVVGERVAQYLLKLTSIQFVEIDYQRMITTVDGLAELRLRGMDAIIVGVTQEYGSQLVTLDRELAERARVKVDVVDLTT